MGQPDLYPLILSSPVIEKLRLLSIERRWACGGHYLDFASNGQLVAAGLAVALPIRAHAVFLMPQLPGGSRIK
jgi:hypothetical protein